MVALYLYAYCKGRRSSREIERACVEDVAYRVIAANRVPDHTTLARFRSDHQEALAGLFGEVLGLCARAGLVSTGVVAVDGTKVHANASDRSNVDYEQLARQMLEESERIDREEDERFGEARGDELPEFLATADGRRGWLREAKRALEDKQVAEAKPIPQSRPQRLREAKHRLELEHRMEIKANQAYEAYRARGVMRDGRRFGRPPDPHVVPEAPAGIINTTDPDSRKVKTPRGYMQGYNAQAVTNDKQIVIAAEVNVDSCDARHLRPMITAACQELEAAGINQLPEVVLGDAGYWNKQHIEYLVSQGMTTLVCPEALKREKPRPGRTGGMYAFMRRVLESEAGHALYKQRQAMIEPVFAHIKHNRRVDHFKRRGRRAARSEWRLITAAHNLMKAWRHGLAPAAG
jgi:Transposase DDE domain/Transposase domain (DUF772)